MIKIWRLVDTISLSSIDTELIMQLIYLPITGL